MAGVSLPQFLAKIQRLHIGQYALSVAKCGPAGAFAQHLLDYR
jgi:hypothetical protein